MELIDLVTRIGEGVVVSAVGVVALRFKNQALTAKLELLEATQSMREAFQQKLDKITTEVTILREAMDRDGVAARLAHLEKKCAAFVKDGHWTRNMFNAVLHSTMPDEQKRDALIERVNRYIRDHYADED